jgi:hypothetical protein
MSDPSPLERYRGERVAWGHPAAEVLPVPCDGRSRYGPPLAPGAGARDLDFRVSCLPTLWGEKVALRLLDKGKLMLDMARLGFEPESLRRFEAAVAKPHGIVLVTGPTGSGKTNTPDSARRDPRTGDGRRLARHAPAARFSRGRSDQAWRRRPAGPVERGADPRDGCRGGAGCVAYCVDEEQGAHQSRHRRRPAG